MGEFHFEEVFLEIPFDETAAVLSAMAKAKADRAERRAEAQKAKARKRRHSARARKFDAAEAAKGFRESGIRVIVKQQKTKTKTLLEKVVVKARKAKTAAQKGLRRAAKVAARLIRKVKAQQPKRPSMAVRLAAVAARAVGCAALGFAERNPAPMVQTEPAMSAKEEKALRNQNKAFFSNACGLPAKVRKALGKKATATQSKVLSDWDLVSGVQNPLEIFDSVLQQHEETSEELLKLGRKASKKPVLTVDPSVGEGFRKWAAIFGIMCIDAEEGNTLGFRDDNWFSLIDLDAKGSNPKARVERLLREAGAEILPGGNPAVLSLHGIEFNLDEVTINGKPGKRAILVFPGGVARMVSPLTAMYFVVTGALAGVEESMKDPRKVFSGYVDVAYARATDGEEVGENDDATAALYEARPPVFSIDFEPYCGLTVTSFEEGKRKEEVYKAVTKAFPTLTAHYQGKYFYDMSACAIGMEVDVYTGKVWLVSSSLAKSWKRHTIAFPLQIRLEKPDVGYFRNGNGASHEGRRVPVLVTKSGINLPYLGMAPSTVCNTDLAKIFKAMTATEHRFVWIGDLREELTLPEEGSKVTVGQALIAGAPEQTPARQPGFVSITEPLTFKDGKTTVTITVSVLDKQGEFKLRSQLAKLQPSTLGLINPDWQRAMKALGYPVPLVLNGDFAIVDGLKNQDPQPVFIYTEDAAKIWGKSSNASGIVALAAETSKTPVVYSPRDHFEGRYDALIERFLTEQKRDIVMAFCVTEDVFSAVREAERPDVKLLVWQDMETAKVYHFVVQTTEAWLGYDLLKVESSSVADAVSRGRYPLEVSAMARVMGMPNYAEEIFEGGLDVFAAAKAIQNSILYVKDGVLTLPDGRSLREAGIKEVNVLEEPSESVAMALADIGRDYRVLTKRVVFTAKERHEDGSVNLKSWVLIDPVVLRTIGGASYQPETINSFFTELCRAVVNQAEHRASLVSRLAGKMKALADSQKSSKRFNRGAEVTICKTVAGMTPNGWAAASYYGPVVRLMAILAGFTKSARKFSLGSRRQAFFKKKRSSLVAYEAAKGLTVKRKQKVCGLVSMVVADVENFVLSGVVASTARFPQTAPLPLRFWFPDAPEHVWNKMKNQQVVFVGASGRLVIHSLLPKGATRSTRVLEPNRIYLSPRDSAWCHGDHDGDLRAFHVVTNSASIVELLTFDVEAHRIGTLKVLQRSVADPMVEAFKLDSKKTIMAVEAVETDLSALHEQNAKTIHHQTDLLSLAYNLAHQALSNADRKPSSSNAMAAHSMWLGMYEVNLGGADDDQIKLGDALQRNKFQNEDGYPDVEAWEDAIFELTQNVGWTDSTAKMLLTFRRERRAYQNIAKGYEEKTLKGMFLVKAVQGGLFRKISAGCIENGKLDPLVAIVGEGAAVTLPSGRTVVIREAIREFAEAGAISARVITRFYDEVYPLVAGRVARNDAEDEGSEFVS